MEKEETVLLNPVSPLSVVLIEKDRKINVRKL